MSYASENSNNIFTKSNDTSILLTLIEMPFVQFTLNQYNLTIITPDLTSHSMGNWELVSGDTLVTQTSQSYPSFFLDTVSHTDFSISGSLQVQINSDDDFIGFVFGYQDSSNFYLLDWKKQTQIHPQGGTAEEGLSIKKIYSSSASLFLMQDFWESSGTSHSDILASNHNEDSGWNYNTFYQFHLNHYSNNFSVTVLQGNNVIWDIAITDSSYCNGRFGFYTFSQEMAEFSANSIDFTNSNSQNIEEWTSFNPDCSGPVQSLGNWSVIDNNNSCMQSSNADPTFLLCPEISSNYCFEANFQTLTHTDNDFIGFVFGLEDSSHFYVFDWKKEEQYDAAYGNALEGFSVKKISANGWDDLTVEDLWNSEGTSNTEILDSYWGSELGWDSFEEYHFFLDFQNGYISIDVIDDSESLWETSIIDPDPYIGKYGFYNHSQPMTWYLVEEINGPLIPMIDVLQLPYPSKSLKVLYKLFHVEQTTSTITLQISEDGGLTWNVPVYHAWGDFGPNTSPGTGKTIYWNAGLDYPNQFNQNMRIKIIADDGE